MRADATPVAYVAMPTTVAFAVDRRRERRRFAITVPVPLWTSAVQPLPVALDAMRFRMWTFGYQQIGALGTSEPWVFPAIVTYAVEGKARWLFRALYRIARHVQEEDVRSSHYHLRRWGIAERASTSSEMISVFFCANLLNAPDEASN